MGYVGSKRRMTNDSCFVLEQLEGWSCHLLRRRRLREEQVLGVVWVKLEMYMRCTRGSVELDVWLWSLGKRYRLDINIWESSEYRWYLKSWAQIRSSWEWERIEKNLILRTKPWSSPGLHMGEMRRNKCIPHLLSLLLSSSSSFFFFYCYERGLFYLIQLAFTWTKLLTQLFLGLLLKSDICFATSKSFKKTTPPNSGL